MKRTLPATKNVQNEIAQKQIEEVGLFNADAAGQLLNRTLFEAISVDLGNEIDLTIWKSGAERIAQAIEEMEEEEETMGDENVSIEAAIEVLDRAVLYGGKDIDRAVMDFEDYDFVCDTLESIQEEIAHRDRAIMLLAKKMDMECCPFSSLDSEWVSKYGGKPTCTPCSKGRNSDTCINARKEWAMKETENV